MLLSALQHMGNFHPQHLSPKTVPRLTNLLYTNQKPTSLRTKNPATFLPYITPIQHFLSLILSHLVFVEGTGGVRINNETFGLTIPTHPLQKFANYSDH